MPRLNAELIINTGSRKGRLVKDELLESLQKNNIHISKVNELRAGHSFESVLAGIIKRSPRLLIVCGGDGTISEVVDHPVNTNIDVGLVPIGTTNNFARSLNIPFDIDGAVKTIRDSKPRYVDLGLINNDYFTNVAGIGLSSLVANHVTNAAKRRWGRFAYAVVGLKFLIKHKPFRVTIQDKDHELKLNFETHQIIVANGRYHAGKEIAVDAKVNNKELLVFALGGRSKWSFIWNMLDFYIGKRKNITHASYLIAQHILLETSSAQIVELDGEVKFETPIEAMVAANAIRIRCQL